MRLSPNRKFYIFILLILSLIISTNIANANLFLNFDDKNICSSEENHDDLKCNSHCVLTQIDEENNIPIEPLSEINYLYSTLAKIKKFSFFLLIQIDSRSPPKFII